MTVSRKHNKRVSTLEITLENVVCYLIVQELQLLKVRITVYLPKFQELCS